MWLLARQTTSSTSVTWPPPEPKPAAPGEIGRAAPRSGVVNLRRTIYEGAETVPDDRPGVRRTGSAGRYGLWRSPTPSERWCRRMLHTGGHGPALGT